MNLSMKQISRDDLFGKHPHDQSLNKRSHQQLQQPEALNCPRYNSTNTKFCYYNNYDTTQPRHFCKACKRHWTKGGTLRNVPLGGGRKNKRFKSPEPAATCTTNPNNTHLQKPYFPDLDDNALTCNTKNLTNQSMQFLSPGSKFESSGSSNYNIGEKQEDREESVLKRSIEQASDFEAWELEAGASNYFIDIYSKLPSSSYWNWNWNDIDTTVGDFSTPNWDDTYIKP